MEILSKMNECKGALAKAYQSPNFSPELFGSVTNKINTVYAEETDLTVELEIIFRSHLDDLVNNSNCKDPIKEDSDVVKLIRFSVDYALYCATSNPTFAKVPFLLIEDLLECQTINNSAVIWDVVENLEEKLTHPALFSRGKLVILKTCNSMLRKLSKSCNTEFCGRILLFLAAIYPISEKSGLNLVGKINTANVTYYESAEQFTESQREAASSTAMAMTSAEGASSGAAVAATATPAAGATAEGGGDLGQQQQAMVVEGGEEEEGEAGEEEGEVGEAPFVLSYDLYSAFWRLQSFFASESKVVDRAGTWRDFMAAVRRTFDLFELSDNNNSTATGSTSSGVASTDSAVKDKTSTKGASATKGVHSARSPVKRGGAVVSDEDEEVVDSKEEVNRGDAYMGCKFLTSSQLFALQLRDPLLRQQVAVQLLYFGHYLRARVPLALTASEPGMLAEVSKDLLYIHDRACAVLQDSPAHGRDLVGVVRRLLSRETHWLAWKNAGGPEIERRPASTADTATDEGDATTIATASIGVKRKASQAELEGKTTSDAYKRTAPKRPARGPARGGGSAVPALPAYEFDCSESNVRERARWLAESHPTFEEQVQDYVDAEDPECGIDAEYHPKLDNVYCWRTRRLMAAAALSSFDAMADGDIGKGLKRMKGIDPEAAEEEPEVEVAVVEAEAAGVETLMPAGESEIAAAEPTQVAPAAEADDAAVMIADDGDGTEVKKTTVPSTPAAAAEEGDIVIDNGNASVGESMAVAQETGAGAGTTDGQQEVTADPPVVVVGAEEVMPAVETADA